MLLITCMAVIIVCPAKAQTSEKKPVTFEDKPLLFLQKQLITKLTAEQLKKQVPKGYSLADETKETIIFEKIVGDIHYEITYSFDENKKMFMVMFTAHVSRTFKIMDEFEVLGYTQDKSLSGMLQKGVEIISYKNGKLKYTAIVTANDNTRKVTVILSNKGYKE